MFPLFTLLIWLYTLFKEQIERAAISVLSAGPIPQHVAFIMDGNRRYARGKHREAFHGHAKGFQTLRHLLKACLELNIKCVSVYAFAIDNFKRPPEEVNALMNLAKEKLYELCEKGELLDQYGIRLCVIGNKSLLPEDVMDAVNKAESLTKHNDRGILNLCMPYASDDEIATAVRKTVHSAVESGSDTTSINESTIEANLMTSLSRSPPLDILIRTSGVRRLSNYMLWQCSENTQIQFVSCYWPDFGLRHFIPIILAYQRKVWGRQKAERDKVWEEE